MALLPFGFSRWRSTARVRPLGVMSLKAELPASRYSCGLRNPSGWCRAWLASVAMPAISGADRLVPPIHDSFCSVPPPGFE